MQTRLLLVAGLLMLAGCSDDGSGDEPESTGSESSAAATAERLPVGKDDLVLDGSDYLSPEGFEPELELDGLSGWTSVHRDADAFDLGQPDPEADAPLVAVAFMVPAETSAHDALATVRRQATDAGSTVTEGVGPFGALTDQGIDVRDGSGEVVASRDGGIALDAIPGGRLRVWAADVGGHPLLVVAFTPDATRSAAADRLLQALAAAVTPT